MWQDQWVLVSQKDIFTSAKTISMLVTLKNVIRCNFISHISRHIITLGRSWTYLTVEVMKEKKYVEQNFLRNVFSEAMKSIASVWKQSDGIFSQEQRLSFHKLDCFSCSRNFTSLLVSFHFSYAFLTLSMKPTLNIHHVCIF